MWVYAIKFVFDRFNIQSYLIHLQILLLIKTFQDINQSMSFKLAKRNVIHIYKMNKL